MRQRPLIGWPSASSTALPLHGCPRRVLAPQVRAVPCLTAGWTALAPVALNFRLATIWRPIRTPCFAEKRNDFAQCATACTAYGHATRPPCGADSVGHGRQARGGR